MDHIELENLRRRHIDSLKPNLKTMLHYLPASKAYATIREDVKIALCETALEIAGTRKGAAKLLCIAEATVYKPLNIGEALK